MRVDFCLGVFLLLLFVLFVGNDYFWWLAYFVFVTNAILGE